MRKVKVILLPSELVYRTVIVKTQLECELTTLNYEKYYCKSYFLGFALNNKQGTHCKDVQQTQNAILK